MGICDIEEGKVGLGGGRVYKMLTQRLLVICYLGSQVSESQQSGNRQMQNKMLSAAGDKCIHTWAYLHVCFSVKVCVCGGCVV